MEKIKLKNIRIYAYHGCLEEEAEIGSFYLVNLTVKLDLVKAGKSDNLKDTVNYAELARIVKEQMAFRSNLLENVAYRVLTQIENKFTAIKKAEISISKLNPPINAESKEVTVVFKKKFH